MRVQPVRQDGPLYWECCTTSALSTWKGQWRRALLGGPKAQTLTSTASPTPLCYPQLWEAAHAQCDPSLGSPEIPIWISGQCWATFPSSSSTAPVRPALRNQSSSTFFLERAAQGHRAASPCWLGKRVWKGNLRHLKH